MIIAATLDVRFAMRTYRTYDGATSYGGHHCRLGGDHTRRDTASAASKDMNAGVPGDVTHVMNDKKSDLSVDGFQEMRARYERASKNAEILT